MVVNVMVIVIVMIFFLLLFLFVMVVLIIAITSIISIISVIKVTTAPEIDQANSNAWIKWKQAWIHPRCAYTIWPAPHSAAIAGESCAITAGKSSAIGTRWDIEARSSTNTGSRNRTWACSSSTTKTTSSISAIGH